MQRKRVTDMAEIETADLWGEPVAGAPYPMSLEQFLAWPEAPGKHYELIRGRLIEMPGTGGGHGSIAADLVVALKMQCGHLGHVLTGEPLFVLTLPGVEEPESMAADVAFVRTERAPAKSNYKAFYAPWHVAPDLVIEIASPSDRPNTVAKKMREWLAGGVKLAWVLWPERRRVDVWRPGDTAPSEELGMADALDAGQIAPFVLPVRDLF
jgi:Uma2 family endonuclease